MAKHFRINGRIPMIVRKTGISTITSIILEVLVNEVKLTTKRGFLPLFV